MHLYTKKHTYGSVSDKGVTLQYLGAKYHVFNLSTSYVFILILSYVSLVACVMCSCVVCLMCSCLPVLCVVLSLCYV